MENRGNKRLLYFAIFVSPLGAGVIGIPIGGVQMSLFRMTIIIALLVLVIQNKGKIVICSPSNRYSAVFMLAWLGYALLSFFWSINYGNWIKAVFFIFVGVTSMILFNNSFSTKEDIEGALVSLNFGIAIQALIGWYEIITQDYRFIEKTQKWQLYFDAGFNREPVAMQGNSNDFGLLMFIGVFIALACYRMANKKSVRRISIILAANYAILTILSGSRACIIGLLIGLGVFLFLQGYKKIFVIVLPIIVLIASPGTVIKLVNNLQFNFNATGGSDAIRVGLLKTGIDYTVRTLGFGVGAGQIEAWVETKGTQYFVGSVTNLHNWWIELLTAYGVAIFVGYIIFYWKLFTCNYRITKSVGTKDIKTLSLSLCSILAGFVVASFSASSNINTEYLWIFWSICIAYQGLRFNLD